ILFFFFSSRRRHTIFSRDWSSDVCSSDLAGMGPGPDPGVDLGPRAAGPDVGREPRRGPDRLRRRTRRTNPGGGTDMGLITPTELIPVEQLPPAHFIEIGRAQV